VFAGRTRHHAKKKKNLTSAKGLQAVTSGKYSRWVKYCFIFTNSDLFKVRAPSRTIRMTFILLAEDGVKHYQQAEHCKILRLQNTSDYVNGSHKKTVTQKVQLISWTWTKTNRRCNEPTLTMRTEKQDYIQMTYQVQNKSNTILWSFGLIKPVLPRHLLPPKRL
jgi:hypothetical protein